MDYVQHRLGSGLSWIRSHGAAFNSSLLFDSLAVPFTDIHFSGSSSRSGSNGDERVVYVDTNGRELSQGEVEHYNHSAIADSPWGFVASRYALTLGVMAVVVNRITHICRPQGRPRSLPLPRRLALQLPAVIFLAYAGLVLLFVTMNSFFPQSSRIRQSASFLRLPQDVQILITSTNPSEEEVHMANAALLWRLFLSVCFAVVSSTLVRTLEGQNNGFAAHADDPNTSPTFNLVGFAVLLHLHASSYSFPPNKHVYLSILLQVGEVLGVQACTCWVNRPPISRLALTTFFGLTSTVHFLVALRSGDKDYPFLQTFSRAPDVALIGIIGLTVFLHALTAAITDTPITFNRLVNTRSLPVSTDDYSLALFKLGTACLSSTRLSGMDSDLIDINTGTETWVEVDGTEVIIREPSGKAASATLNGDGRGGLAREIRKIKTSRTLNIGTNSQSFHFASPRWREATKFGTMLFNTIQAIFIIGMRKLIALLPFNIPRIPIPARVYNAPHRLRLLWHGTNGEERRRTRIQEERRREEVQRQRLESDRLFQERAEERNRAAATSTAVASSSNTEGIRRRERTMSPSISTPWQRFFSQEFPDEEDDEWEEEIEEEEIEGEEKATGESDSYWQSLGQGALLADDVEEDDDDDNDDDAEEEVESQEGVGDVSSELLQLARVDFDEGEIAESASYTNVLMAHLSRRQEGVLTRRGYHRLIGSQSQAEEEAQHLINVISQRRRLISPSEAANSSSSSSERERMRLCVICYIEDRTIICWPCKCLALCEGCREAMASRPPPRSHIGTTTNQVNSTHTCPTCRTPVVGYSRLFLP